MNTQQSPSFIPDFDIDPEKTALIVVDMNYVDAHRDYGVAHAATKLGFDLEPFYNAVEISVIPNIKTLLELFRRNGMKVVYTVIGAELSDLSDIPLNTRALFRAAGMDSSVPGNKEFEIREEIQPKDGELILCKKSSGAFNSTNIDQMLRNMGVDTLVVVGVATNFCVYLTAADAADRGYQVIVISDATAAMSPELQDIFLMVGSIFFFKVESTEEVTQRIKRT